MRFVKAHAYGNDFLYVEEQTVAGVALAALAREMCDRHTGVGADGLIVFSRTPAGARMRLHNADGSHAEVTVITEEPASRPPLKPVIVPEPVSVLPAVPPEAVKSLPPLMAA